MAPRAIPIAAVAHSAVQGLAPWATALKRTAGGTARATRTYAENLGSMTIGPWVGLAFFSIGTTTLAVWRRKRREDVNGVPGVPFNGQ